MTHTPSSRSAGNHWPAHLKAVGCYRNPSLARVRT
jgi:hypothetical protein